MSAQLRSILLVEDNPLDLELTLHELAQYRLVNEVIIARDGQEALDYLHRRGQFVLRRVELPAVVLLDLKLPKIDGLQVLAEMKSDPALVEVPVVVLTTTQNGPDMKRCRALGVQGYLPKPVNFHELIDTLAQLGLVFAIQREPLRAES
ncbi:MAG TPA: response regulator [Phycisphaerae bacterium]|jgi:CheY-like chemotaxis protein